MYSVYVQYMFNQYTFNPADRSRMSVSSALPRSLHKTHPSAKWTYGTIDQTPPAP